MTVDLPPLSLRAEVSSIDDTERTAELIFSTGAAVERMDWFSGKRYLEVLGMKAENIDLARLNAAGPLLDSHSAWSVADVLGSVIRGSARVDKGQAIAKVRFSRRDAVTPIWNDVRDGILSSVSVGYRVTRFEETEGKNGALPTRLATRWTPFEISLVSMPADVGAKVRDGDKSDTAPCVIVRRTSLDHTDADRLRSFRLALARA